MGFEEQVKKKAQEVHRNNLEAARLRRIVPPVDFESIQPHVFPKWWEEASQQDRLAFMDKQAEMNKDPRDPEGTRATAKLLGIDDA